MNALAHPPLLSLAPPPLHHACDHLAKYIRDNWMVSIWLSKGCDDHQIPQPLLARYYNKVSELVLQGLASTMMGRLRPKGVNLIGAPADCICEATPSIVFSSNQHCSRPNIVLLRRNAITPLNQSFSPHFNLPHWFMLVHYWDCIGAPATCCLMLSPQCVILIPKKWYYNKCDPESKLAFVGSLVGLGSSSDMLFDAESPVCHTDSKQKMVLQQM